MICHHSYFFVAEYLSPYLLKKRELIRLKPQYPLHGMYGMILALEDR